MVDGETKVTKAYFDEETGNTIDVELSIRDHIFFRLLKKIVGALSK